MPCLLSACVQPVIETSLAHSLAPSRLIEGSRIRQFCPGVRGGRDERLGELSKHKRGYGTSARVASDGREGQLSNVLLRVSSGGCVHARNRAG